MRSEENGIESYYCDQWTCPQLINPRHFRFHFLASELETSELGNVRACLGKLASISSVEPSGPTVPPNNLTTTAYYDKAPESDCLLVW